MKKTLLTALAVAVLASVSSAHAACRLSQFLVPGVSTVYDPFENNFTPVPIGITANTSGGKDCNGARLLVALGPTSTSPQTGTRIPLSSRGQELYATLTDAGGQTRAVTTPATAFTGNQIALPLGASGLLSGGPLLRLNLTPGQAVSPGNYTALLSILTRVVDAKGGVSDSSTPLFLTVYVKPSVRLAAGGGDLHIDVGELTAGATGGPVSFDAYANLDYELLLVSDNDFTLARNGQHGAGGVPYLPIVSNQPVTATAGVQGKADSRRVVFGAPGNGGRRHHTFGVRILPFSGLPAGDYSDLLTLDIRAKV